MSPLFVIPAQHFEILYDVYFKQITFFFMNTWKYYIKQKLIDLSNRSVTLSKNNLLCNSNKSNSKFNIYAFALHFACYHYFKFVNNINCVCKCGLSSL